MPVMTLEGIQEAVATHLSRLGEKLRRDKLRTGYVSIYIRSSPFKEGYTRQDAFKIITPPTNDTYTLLKEVLPATVSLFQKGISYKKAGVLACDLSPESSSQPKLIPIASDLSERSPILDKTIDSLNQRFGKGTIRYAVCGLRPQWKTKSIKKSPSYTTAWSQLKVVT